MKKSTKKKLQKKYIDFESFVMASVIYSRQTKTDYKLFTSLASKIAKFWQQMDTFLIPEEQLLCPQAPIPKADQEYIKNVLLKVLKSLPSQIIQRMEGLANAMEQAVKKALLSMARNVILLLRDHSIRFNVKVRCSSNSDISFRNYILRASKFCPGKPIQINSYETIDEKSVLGNCTTSLLGFFSNAIRKWPSLPDFQIQDIIQIDSFLKVLIPEPHRIDAQAIRKRLNNLATFSSQNHPVSLLVDAAGIDKKLAVKVVSLCKGGHFLPENELQCVHDAELDNLFRSGKQIEPEIIKKAFGLNKAVFREFKKHVLSAQKLSIPIQVIDWFLDRYLFWTVGIWCKLAFIPRDAKHLELRKTQNMVYQHDDNPRTPLSTYIVVDFNQLSEVDVSQIFFPADLDPNFSLLYHGTSSHHADAIITDGIDLEKCKSANDFGLGFYLTSSFQRAAALAIHRTLSFRGQYPTVLIFVLNNALFNEMPHYEFSSLENQNELTLWDRFVKHCRSDNSCNRFSPPLHSIVKQEKLQWIRGCEAFSNHAQISRPHHRCSPCGLDSNCCQEVQSYHPDSSESDRDGYPNSLPSVIIFPKSIYV